MDPALTAAHLGEPLTAASHPRASRQDDLRLWSCLKFEAAQRAQTELSVGLGHGLPQPPRGRLARGKDWAKGLPIAMPEIAERWLSQYLNAQALASSAGDSCTGQPWMVSGACGDTTAAASRNPLSTIFSTSACKLSGLTTVLFLCVLLVVHPQRWSKSVGKYSAALLELMHEPTRTDTNSRTTSNLELCNLVKTKLT